MSSLALKLVAVLTMTIDHIGAILYWTQEYNELSRFMRVIGRIAFPIYVFLIAVGMSKTRDRVSYLTRLFIFALISYAPFSIFYCAAMRGPGTTVNFIVTDHTNVFFSLFLGASSVYLYDLIKKRLPSIWGAIAGLFAPAACAAAAWLIGAEYGAAGILAIFFSYFAITATDNTILRAVPLALWVLYQYGGRTDYTVFAMTAPLLVSLFDGSHGSLWLKKLKYLFYAWYPLTLIGGYVMSLFI